jgi:hypothetical protein
VRLYCEAQGEWHELMAQDFRESEQWAAALRRWTLVHKGMTPLAPSPPQSSKLSDLNLCVCVCVIR